MEQDDTLKVLFDKLVGRPGFNTATNYVMTKDGQPERILDLLKLLSGPSPTILKEHIVHKLLHFLGKSTRNRQICCNHIPLLETLIRMIPSFQPDDILEKFLLLVEIVGKFSMNARQSKKYLRLFNNEQLSEQKKVLLIKCLQNIVTHKGPRVFFDFDAIQSGIKLPDVEKWPSSSYTISFWMCIESFEDPTGSQFYEPRIFSFLTPGGTGVEAYFMKRSLFLRTNQSNKLAVTVNFETSRWYHVTITHSYSAMEWLSIARSAVKVYINGKLEFESTLKFPDISESLISCFLGSSAVVDTAFIHIPERRHFYGQLGMFCLFGEALTASQVTELYTLGYNYVPNFHKKDLFTKHGAPKSILVQSPKACDGDSCLNMANFHSSSSNNNKKKNGKMLGTVSIVTTSHVKDSIYCAAGAQMLYPMFHKLTECQPSAELINSLLLLLCDIVSDHISLQKELSEINGFAVLGLLLEKISKFLDPNSVVALEKLIKTISVSDAVVREAYASLVFNFDIWVNTALPIQKALCAALEKRVESNPQFFRLAFGVQRFIDILRNYYSISEESEIKSPESARSTAGRRLTEDDLKALQHSLLRSVGHLLNESIEMEELQSIVYFLQECTDPLQLIGVLRLLFELLSKPVKNVLHHLENLGGIRPLVCLLHKQNENVRQMAVKVIGKYLQQAGPKTKLKVLAEYGTVFLSETFPLTESIYYCLVEILVEEYSLTTVPASSKLVGESKKLMNPQILPSIFRLSLESGDSELQQKVVQDFVLCLNHNPQTFEPFIEQWGWQGWILAFLAKEPSQRPSSPIPVPRESNNNNDEGRPRFFSMRSLAIAHEHKVTEEMVLYLLVTLLHNSFFIKDGWKVLEDTESFVNYFAENGQIHSETMLRTIYTELLTSLEKDVIKENHTKPNPFWKNLANFIILVDEFLFHPSIHRDYDAKWTDYSLVLKLLEVFDLAIRPPDNSHLTGVEISSGKGKDVFMIMLRLTLLTFQEAFSFHFGRLEDDNGVKGEKQTNVELEKLFYRNVQRVRHLLSQVQITNASSKDEREENNKKMMWTLSLIVKAIRRSLKYNDTSHTIIIPLAKEILRNNISTIVAYSVTDVSMATSELVYQESSPIGDFIQYLDSVDFYSMFQKIENYKTEFEQETFSPSSKVDSRREKNLSSLKNKIRKDLNNETISKKKLDSECFSTAQKQRTAEVERRSNATMAYVENRKKIKQIWKKMRRDLMNERSCWASNERIWWKLDFTENSSRMRLKLKRNYRGSDHKEASLAWRRQNAEILEKRKQDLQILDKKEEEPSANFLRTSTESNGEEFLRTLAGIHITVRKNSNDMIEEFDFNSNELEDSWFMVDEHNFVDTMKISGKILFTSDAQLINPLTICDGRFVLTANSLHFLVTRNPSSTNKQKRDKQWTLESIIDVQKRRYLLRNQALEIFLNDQRSYLFNFPTNTRKKVLQILVKLCPGRVEGINMLPSELLKRSGYTQQWQRGEMSNFEYLMKLNTLSGRTFNDLTQYPVFPWIISDYTSPSLDVNNPSIYRDLSKPVGALNPNRLQQFVERYEAFDDPNIPKFYYGSHYSSLGTVLYFTIRMEPFTTQFLENLQGGSFDIADRMFHSVASTWHNCMTSPSDVKELIPEFYYLSDFLRNSNSYDLGTTQTEEKLNDVVLPPWAKTPEDFIRINREALESEYVSNNLHEWIDLIFGYKQTGKPAEKAYNLFYYLTYEGSVEIDQIKDPVERMAIESQIANFGQTPSQLLTQPHPKRNVLDASKLSIFNNPALLKAYVLTQIPFSASYLVVTSTEVWLVSNSCDLSAHKWNLTPDPKVNPASDLPCSFSVNSYLTLPANIQEHVTMPFAVFTDDMSLVVCSKWDSSFRLLDGAKVNQTVMQHKDKITCFAISKDNKILVSGSKDTTVCVWSFKNKAKLKKLDKESKKILRGHDEEITCVALSTDLDICISGSKDKTIVLHTLLYGNYVRTVVYPNRQVPSKIALANSGLFATYSSGDHMIHLFDINGRLLVSVKSKEELCDIAITKDSQYLLTGGSSLTVRKLHSLEFVHSFPFDARIVSFKLAPEETSLFVVLETGRLVYLSLPKTPTESEGHQYMGFA